MLVIYCFDVAYFLWRVQGCYFPQQKNTDNWANTSSVNQEPETDREDEADFTNAAMFSVYRQMQVDVTPIQKNALILMARQLHQWLQHSPRLVRSYLNRLACENRRHVVSELVDGKSALFAAYLSELTDSDTSNALMTYIIEECGANVDQYVQIPLDGGDCYWTNVLIQAAHDMCKVPVRLLVEHGASVNEANQFGDSPLYLACKRGYTDRFGGHTYKKGNHGCSPLMAACQGGHRHIAEYLLQNEAKPNVKDISGMTALMWSAKEGHTECVQQLVRHCADVNLQDKSGLTALMWASKEGNPECVKYIIENKSDHDLSTRDHNGLTALAWASKEGHPKCAYLIKRYANTRT